MQQQTWDPSVKALAAVPQVLAMMNDKLDWTQALGDAYLSQPDDIAAAVQRLRMKAQASGNLQASSQQRVRRVRAPQPIIIDGRPEPEYIVIEPVDPGILYVPIYDPYVVYGVWAYPAYRPFFWYPPGYVSVGVFGFGAPFVVGAALWAQYNWASHHVDINVVNYNKFNHTNIVSSAANQTWQHDPLHRGNIPYSNPALQTKFGKAATGNANLNPGLQKTNLTKPVKVGTSPVNNNAIDKLNKNGGLKSTDVKIDKNTSLKVDKNVDLKVDKSTKLNVNQNTNTNNTNKSSLKTPDRRVNLSTDTKVNTNAVIKNNAANNISHSVSAPNVPRNVPAVSGAGNVQKGKKPLQP